METPFLPLDQFVLKVHSRCDLACDHCYVYEAADQGWRKQPKAMPGDVLRQAARRIAEHAVEHGLARFRSCCMAASHCWPVSMDCAG